MICSLIGREFVLRVMTNDEPQIKLGPRRGWRS